MRMVGLLAIVIVAFAATVSAVPRYSAPVTQVGDSPAIRFDETTTQRPNAPVLQRIKEEAKTCKTASDLDSPSASQSSKVKKTTVDNKEWDFKMSMDVSTVLVAAALSLSNNKLAEIAKDAYCFQNNSQRAKKNRGIPENIYDARNSELYRELPEELSILHNFREDLKLDTSKDRLIAGLGAAAEYKAWKDHKMDRSEWKYLDPDLPNVKFIEVDGGHKEAVYNRHTEMLVDHGNNQGTYNDYDQDPSSTEKALHGIKDVVDWGLCGTPADNERISTKWRAVLVEVMQGHKSEEIDTSKLEALQKERINQMNPLLAGFDSSRLKRAEGCNACKCKHETGNLKPQIWRNGLDDGYLIVILCAECMAVKYSVDVEDKKKKELKICSCASPDVFFAGVCRKKIGVLDKLWTQHYCRNCGGFCRGSMLELTKTDKGVSVYPAGSVPSDWDGKIYEQSELDAHVKSIVK